MRPADRRDGSRLMVLPRAGGPPDDRRFTDLPDLLHPGDLLVGNDTRVMAARVRAVRATGGRVEFLLLGTDRAGVEALANPARRLKLGETLAVEGGGEITVLERPDPAGILRVRTEPAPPELMAATGEMPLPPYLGRAADAVDATRYQTVFAGPLGAAAAPTAGLHFTPEVFGALDRRGVGFATVTLHVGIGTFRPLRPEQIAQGLLHPEWFSVPATTAEAVAATRARGGRVIAIGTTSARTLEAATTPGSRVPKPGSSTTRLFIQPGSEVRCIDGLLTNFHLPKSSLLMLVAALVGRERLLSAYTTAVERGYRFYSYGDAMLVTPTA